MVLECVALSLCGVCWSHMHVNYICISYTFISCACCTFLMVDYGYSMVIMENLILI